MLEKPWLNLFRILQKNLNLNLEYSKLNCNLSRLIHNTYIFNLEWIYIEYSMCDPTMGKKSNKDCYEKVLTNHSKYFLRKYHQTKLQSHDIKHMWKHCLQWGKVMNINLNIIFLK